MAFVTHIVNENFTPTGNDKSYLTTNSDGEIVTFSMESFHTQINSAVAAALKQSKDYTDAETKKVQDAVNTKHEFAGGVNGMFSGTFFPHPVDKFNYISGTTHVHDLRFGSFQLNENLLHGMLQPCIVWQNDFHGHWTPFQHGDWNDKKLNERHMNNRVTSLWTGSFKVRIFVGGDFSGDSISYDPQTWVAHTQIKSDKMNDRMSSIKVRFPWETV